MSKKSKDKSRFESIQYRGHDSLIITSNEVTKRSSIISSAIEMFEPDKVVKEEEIQKSETKDEETVFYEILKKVSERTTPEQMGKDSRKILSEIHALSIFYIPLYYMAGRMGEICRNNNDPRSESNEKREQTMFILDFWKRLASSYFPSDKISVLDSEKMNIALDQSDVDLAMEHVLKNTFQMNIIGATSPCCRYKDTKNNSQ